MSATPAFVRSWRAGRYRCTLTAPLDAEGLACASIEWDPVMPATLTDGERQQYERGRNAALSEYAMARGACAMGGDK